jgi:hypothetical protein
MTKRVDNLVHETTTTTGTGDKTLTSVTGRKSFNTAFGNADAANWFYYHMTSRAANQYESGRAYMSDATTMVVLEVLSGSNGTSAVDFSAGTIDVTSAYPREVQELTEDGWRSGVFM